MVIKMLVGKMLFLDVIQGLQKGFSNATIQKKRKRYFLRKELRR